MRLIQFAVSACAAFLVTVSVFLFSSCQPQPDPVDPAGPEQMDFPEMQQPQDPAMPEPDEPEDLEDLEFPEPQEPEIPQPPEHEELPDPQEPDDLGMFEQELQQPEAVDIEDPDWDPETTLAEINGHHISLQDLYEEFAGIPPMQQQQLQHRQHDLLEAMVQQRLLYQTAREEEVDETEKYQEMLQHISESPMAEDFSEQEIEKSAMMETLLQKEVVNRVEITEEDLREVYEQYSQIMGDEADFEQIRPQLEQVMLQQHVEEYIDQLYAGAEIELEEDWVREKEEEAQQAQQPAVPDVEGLQ